MQKPLLEQESLSKKLIKKGFRAYIFIIFTAPLSYLLRLIASNTLSVSDIGIFYGVLSMIVLLYSYNDLGLTESMQYFLPKYWLEGKRGQIKNTIGLSFLMQLITGIIIFSLLFFNADWIAVNHFHTIQAVSVIKIMSLYFLGYNIIQVCNAVFVAFQDTFSSGMMNFVNVCSALIFTILFRLGASFNLSFFALAWILGVAMGIGIGVIQLIKKYPDLFKLPKDKIDKTIVTTQFKYAFWVFLTTNVSMLLGNVDQQLVLNKLGTEASGYFTNMLSLLGIFILLVNPFLNLLFPVTTELSTRKEKEKFKLLESTTYTHFAFLAIVIGGIFLVFGQEISVLLYGEKFRFSGELLQVLGPCLIFNCLSTLNFYLLAGLGKIKQRFTILLVSLIVNVTCNALVLYVFNLDLHAVVFVLALSWFVQFVGGLLAIRKEHPFEFDRKFFIKNILIVGALVLLFGCVKNLSVLFTPNQNRWQLLFMLAGICIIYVGIIAGFNRGRIRNLIYEVKKIRNTES